MHLIDKLMEFIEERLAFVLKISILLQLDFILPLRLFELAFKLLNFDSNFLKVTLNSLMADLLFLKLLLLLLSLVFYQLFLFLILLILLLFLLLFPLLLLFSYLSLFFFSFFPFLFLSFSTLFF